jgi:hypothetical protein
MPLKVSADDIIDRRKAFRKWFRGNYEDEITDTWRAANMRVKPIMWTNPDTGKLEEDPYRTNVAMPEICVVNERQTARLTANPPQINYTAPDGAADLLAERLTAASFQQFDRSGEAIQHFRHINQGTLLGLSLKKHYWDKLTVNRRFKYDMGSITRDKLLGLQGVSSDEIGPMVEEMGNDLQPEEIAQAIAQYGNRFQDSSEFTKYEGPCAKTPFLLDCFWEPDVYDFNQSSFVGEEFTESDLFLRKMAQTTYVDRHTGEEKTVFDPALVEELIKTTIDYSTTSPNKKDDITQTMKEALSMTPPRMERRLLPNKKFDFIECHEPDEDGWMWVSWVGNPDNSPILLGSMPYQWDLYGKFAYTPLVLKPNLLSAVGNSTCRQMRFLHKLHNATVGRTQDITQEALQPTYQVRHDNDVPDEVLRRSAFKVIVSNQPMSLMERPQVPNEAWEMQGQIRSMQSQLAPVLNTVETGSASNPQAGKFATTAVLNAKSTDSLTNAELQFLNLSLKDEGEKKLWMWQQELDDPMQISSKFIPAAHQSLLSERYGKTVCINPEELQYDIEVEPEAGSMLAVDDELKTASAQTFASIAFPNPDVFDKRYAAEVVAGTIRGVDKSKAVIPPQPIPPFKNVNLSVSCKLEDLPAAVQTSVLQQAGFQITPEGASELDTKDQLKAVGEMSEAADHAQNLETPADTRHPAEIEQAKNTGGPQKGAV